MGQQQSRQSNADIAARIAARIIARVEVLIECGLDYPAARAEAFADSVGGPMACALVDQHFAGRV
jgi:hypothetical protein